MLLKVITVGILLDLFIHGFDRVIAVAESDVTDDGLLIDDEKDNITTRAIRSDGILNTFKNSCNTDDNCSCLSLCNTLANLTSNSLVNITTDMELFTIIPLFDLTNVTIIGHNDPTVNCNNSGGLQFMSCHNCTIEKVTWLRCGARNVIDNGDVYSVLQLTNSLDIMIKNCSFQYSIGQAIALSEMLGDVSIEDCSFSYNKQYEGHGAAIHYSNNMLLHYLIKFMISGCKYFYNERAKSIVYFNQRFTNVYESLNLQNSKFHHNEGVPIYLSHQDLHIYGSIELYNNTAENGGGIFISDHSNVIFHKGAAVNFTSNRANNYGGGICLTNHSSILFKDHSATNHKLHKTLDDQYLAHSFTNVTFHNNRASGLGQGIYAINSNITFSSNVKVIFHNDFHHDSCSGSSFVYIENYSAITFGGNSCDYYWDKSGRGVGIYVVNHSIITFRENSNITFTNNKVYGCGRLIYIYYLSTSTFKENSTVTFNNNNNKVYSSDGRALSIYHSTVTFQGNSKVTFDNNEADNKGGAVHVSSLSTLTFEGSSLVMFKNSKAYGDAGVIYVEGYSTVIFQGNSTVVFNNNNSSANGGAMSIYYSTITFEGSSMITFSNNKADMGGAVYAFHGKITFGGTSMVTFNKTASNSGAIYICHSNIILERNSSVLFDNNKAYSDGGAIYMEYSNIMFKGYSVVSFNANEAYANGGALYTKHSIITFEENSSGIYHENRANDKNGGATYVDENSVITFKGNTTVLYCNNTANDIGGALFVDHNSNITFKEKSIVKFCNNQANDNGGVMYVDHYSHVSFKGKSTVTFYNNKAIIGGALYVDHNSCTRYIENSTVMFDSNKANMGGSIFSKFSFIDIQGNTFVGFINNTALQDGGAIYLSDHSKFSHFGSTILFYDNIASDYGRAIYVLFKESSINFSSSNIHFKERIAGSIQKPVYINVPNSCDSNCLFRSFKIANKSIVQVTTSPNKLKLYNPAKCIGGNDTKCDNYYVNNIMLGQEIMLNACVLDYYDQPTEATQFLITGMNHQDYNTSGSQYISIACNQTTQGITVVGNLHSNNSYNYSVIISLYVTRVSESKTISMNLTVGLSQCHPGFWYSSDLQKCECYDTENIVSCSGSNSTIRRGYWFGIKNRRPTITSCPNDYCNFTCCEITNGIYHLSPVRANQCKPHRSGTACGNCEKGYTLSFDSPDCVDINNCTIGQTMLVITLSFLYWIAAVVTVFVMTYFKVTIGSLYAIIYYYSIVDILLTHALFNSNGLYTTINVMSSLAKLTPQFLGKLCLVKNMSGIDQQFIHYVHPTVILLILIIISMLARRSRRVSSFVSRGIIHFICFLLLLSYTSVATTSLLLMRPITFMDINKVYTYLSPDVEYFHGRHLVYVIIAIILIIVIVISLPLLLLLEPFLNSKINFIKIKPLLDQFQGCYKDKCRCFAGYYMICRLIIILLIIVKISNDFTNQYLLMSSCALMELTHVLVRPYVSTILNVFDGIILQLIVIISGLSTVKLVDNYNEAFVLVITYLLVILPLISFVIIKLWVNGKAMHSAFNRLYKKFTHKYTALVISHDVEEPTEMNEIGIIIDDNMRRNAIVVDVNEESEERLPDIIWCREPFMEELNDIEALNDIKT